MKEYNLTDIPIESAAKIFRFLNYFLKKKNLDPEYLKINLKKFTYEEQYFLCKYALEYYSLEDGTYLDKWMREQVSLLGGYDESRSLITEIVNNVKEIKSIFNFKNRGIIEKNFATSRIIKQANATYLPAHGVEQKIKIVTKKNLTNIRPRKRIAIMRTYRSYKRIPLYCVGKELFEKFKAQFFDNLKMCLDHESTEKLFYNTFEFQGNPHHLQLLNLKVAKKSQLEIAIGALTKSYKEIISDHVGLDSYIKYNKSVDERRKSVNRLKRKFIPKKLGQPIEIQRIHFMRAMYNGFTYLREAYHKDLLNNPALDLDSFLRKRLKNTSNA